MKSVLISIQPKWVEKITSGEKTIEVRKTAPKCDMPFKCYIYCTKTKNKWALSDYEGAYQNSKGEVVNAQGKVIGEFICDKVDEYTFSHYEAEYQVTHVEQNAMCLNQPELIHYGKGKPLYGWHISDLKIYDKPRELSEFYRECEKPKCEGCPYFYVVNTPSSYETYCEVDEKIPITRPPQSWCYVEELER